MNLGEGNEDIELRFKGNAVYVSSGQTFGILRTPSYCFDIFILRQLLNRKKAVVKKRDSL
jgi:hypothetical protein